jgi:hypothetical protein
MQKIENEDLFKGLEKKLDRQNELVERRISFWHNFLLGIVRGVGSVIGATLIGGILIGILVANLDKLEKVPLLRRIVDVEQIEDYIEE